MSELKIPMFPLSIFPLPGEMIPLHIFEPRYRQLLEDAEVKDIAFGIYYNQASNTEKLGSLVKLESVIKRYQTGESDIIVKCIGIILAYGANIINPILGSSSACSFRELMNSIK